MSLRKAKNHHCLNCVYDKLAPGTWRQRVSLCSVKSCALYDVRPKPTCLIPESTLRWYGVDLAEYQALMTNTKDEQP